MYVEVNMYVDPSNTEQKQETDPGRAALHRLHESQTVSLRLGMLILVTQSRNKRQTLGELHCTVYMNLKLLV